MVKFCSPHAIPWSLPPLMPLRLSSLIRSHFPEHSLAPTPPHYVHIFPRDFRHADSPLDAFPDYTRFSATSRQGSAPVHLFSRRMRNVRRLTRLLSDLSLYTSGMNFKNLRPRIGLAKLSTHRATRKIHRRGLGGCGCHLPRSSPRLAQTKNPYLQAQQHHNVHILTLFRALQTP
jgi:hypothetical protein